MEIYSKFKRGLALSAVALLCYGMLKADKYKKIKPAGNGLALLELFTSEGCSSCPPADKLLAKLEEEDNNLLVLSYHVDYWDHLGWKDPFSKAAFSQRQRQYAKKFNLESVYTPQVIINGNEEMVGSDEDRLRTSLLKNHSLTALEVKFHREDSSTISLTCKINNKETEELNIAFVRPNATTSVKKGENSGRTLQHVNVVYQLSTIHAGPGELRTEIKIPDALQSIPFKIILFLQRKKDGQILSVSNLNFPK